MVFSSKFFNDLFFSFVNITLHHKMSTALLHGLIERQKGEIINWCHIKLYLIFCRAEDRNCSTERTLKLKLAQQCLACIQWLNSTSTFCQLSIDRTPVFPGLCVTSFPFKIDQHSPSTFHAYRFHSKRKLQPILLLCAYMVVQETLLILPTHTNNNPWQRLPNGVSWNMMRMLVTVLFY